MRLTFLYVSFFETMESEVIAVPLEHTWTCVSTHMWRCYLWFSNLSSYSPRALRITAKCGPSFCTIILFYCLTHYFACEIFFFLFHCACSWVVHCFSAYCSRRLTADRFGQIVMTTWKFPATVHQSTLSINIISHTWWEDFVLYCMLFFHQCSPDKVL